MKTKETAEISETGLRPLIAREYWGVIQNLRFFLFNLIKMGKIFSKFYFENWNHDSEKEIAKVFAKIHSTGKGEDSPGDFEFERTRKINSRAL